MAGSSQDVDAALPRAPVERVDALIADYVASLDLPPRLAEAVSYAALGGGKRLRPTMVMLAARASGGSWDSALPAAAAIEMMHAFTLVHDDLPAMDDDDLRRGRPTVHIQFGEAMAILVGDCLMGLSMQILCERTSDPTLAGLLVGELSGATTRVIAGQVYDTMGGLPADLGDRERLELIHRNKTGALFRAACRLGAISGTWRDGACDAAMLDLLTRYGETTGLMFQIVDDLLDVEASSETAGKRTAKDAAMGKLTYPGVLGLAESRAAVQSLRDDAVGMMRPLGEAGAGLASLAELFANRTM